MSELVLTERSGSIATLTLNRREQRNAVSSAMLTDLVIALGDLATEPSVRVVVLRGEGPDFCAGADLGELEAAREGPGAIDYGRSLDAALRAIESHPLPVIAQVQGAAIGAGCQLTVGCDLAVAATDARFAIPSARLGIVIPFESLERLVLAIGPKRAGELLYTGRVISGEMAALWGLVNEAVAPGALQTRTEQLAISVADAAPLSVRGSKRGIAGVLGSFSLDRLANGYRLTDFDMMAAQALASDDLTEGLRAFRERRAPEFRGE